jgi:GT2 family glycosyltransferase
MEVSEVDQPGISVITVNSGRNLQWLRRCRMSVMAQQTTHFKSEHVIIDNLLHNKTYTEALNEGVEVSNFPYVLVLDDDDMLHQEAIEKLGTAMIEAGKKSKKPVYRVSCNQLLINITGEPIGQLVDPCFGLLDKELLLTLDLFPYYGWGIFTHPNTRSPDYILNRAASKLEYGHIVLHEPLYAKRVHRGMASFLQRQELYEEVLYNAEMGQHMTETPEGDTELKSYAEGLKEHSHSDIKKKVLVGIVTHNNEKTLRRCLSELAYSTYKNFGVLVVDNCSEDATKAEIKNFEQDFKVDIGVIVNETNDGFPYGCNQIIQYALDIKDGYDAILMLNPDVYLPMHGIEYMLACMERNMADIVGAEELAPTGDVTHNLVAYNENEKEFDKVRNVSINWSKFGVPREVPVPGVTFSCALIDKKVYERMKLDNVFGMGYFEDVDYCIRAKKIGARIFTTPYVKFIHHRHTSWNQKPREMLNNLYKKNYNYLIKKYGKQPIMSVNEWIKLTFGVYI